MLLFTHHSSLIDERGSSAVSSKSLGGTVNSNVNLVRETGHALSPKLPKNWENQVRNITKQYALQPPNVL